MEVSLARRIAAEVVGTGILVLFGAGSVVAALRVGGGELDYPGLGMVAITFAFAIAVAIYAFGTTSGESQRAGDQRSATRCQDIVGRVEPAGVLIESMARQCGISNSPTSGTPPRWRTRRSSRRSGPRSDEVARGETSRELTPQELDEVKSFGND